MSCSDRALENIFFIKESEGLSSKCWTPEKKRFRGKYSTGEWAHEIPELIEKITEYLQENLRIIALEKEIEFLKNRITKLEENKSIIVPIETFAPEPYELLKPFHIVLQQDEDEFIASFFEANLGASGDTKKEAIDNLKDIVISTLEILKEHKKSQLGPEPLRQLKVLEEFIREIP